MNSELPKVFANKIDKDFNNNREYYVSNDKEPIKKVNINKKIKELFSSYKYVYKIDTIIETDEGIIEKTIIGKKNNNLITIDNELIDIGKIKDINIK